MKNKETFTDKLRNNKWMALTIVLGILVIILIIGNIMKVNKEVKSENELLCSTIKGTPAWASEGKVIAYGLAIPENMSIDLINSYLIPDRIKFLYVEGCEYCEAQINYFKTIDNSWDKYVNEGLVVNCSEYLK